MRKLLVLIFALTGLFASVYLTWSYTSPSHTMVCLGTGCDAVRASRFAYPFGVPMPVFGLVFYTLLVVLVLAEAHIPQRSAKIWGIITALAGVGVVFSAWLTYLEAFVLHAWCVWCVVQAISVLLLFLLSIGVSRTTSSQLPRARYAIVILAVLAAIPAMLYLTGRESQNMGAAPVQPKPQQAQVVLEGPPQLIRDTSHWTGNPKAKLTIVEFADFQCPSCGTAEKTNRVIRDQFGDKVKYVFRQFPLETIHEYAFQAAKASECAGDQSQFWPMLAMLYDHQAQLTAPDLRRYANMLGLDTAKFDACLEDPAVTRRIRIDIADANGLQVRATPTFFLNGQKHEGALTLLDVAGAISAAEKGAVPKASAKN